MLGIIAGGRRVLLAAVLLAVAFSGGDLLADDSPKRLITNSIGMKLRLIPAGEFMMGATKSPDQLASLFNLQSAFFEQEFPRHRVRISKSFYLQTTEVTQGEWKSVMGTSPWTHRRGIRAIVEASDQIPATCLSWDDAVEFCRKLSATESIDYRLPTEAEWEYASRAGRESIYSFGDNPNSLTGYAWFAKNSFDIGEEYPHRVAQKRANLFGLYDMHGNVGEWCSDRYGNNYYESSPSSDPRGPSSGSPSRVIRGGHWGGRPSFCRSAFRSNGPPDYQSKRLGFRVLRVVVKTNPVDNAKPASHP